MIQKLFFYESPGVDPYRNLAIEEYLLEKARDRAILYLWQNQNTVVIGKNQNPWKECKTTLLEEEGGHLARRLSGGGAVFHDRGNLNFTILLPQEDYDLDRQFSVVARAVKSLGIPAERSGRNDLLAEGRKFSGNAFYKNGTAAYHHGTLLIRADMEKMGRYLSPSKLKLKTKGVDSVRSRVENLCFWRPDITVAEVKAAMKEAFSREYGLSLAPLPPPEEDKITPLLSRYESWEWNYGRNIPFTCTLEKRFSWGGAEVCLQVEAGTVREARIYTDAMDIGWVPDMEKALTGCRFEKSALCSAAAGIETAPEIRDVFSEMEE